MIVYTFTLTYLYTFFLLKPSANVYIFVVFFIVMVYGKYTY